MLESEGQNANIQIDVLGAVHRVDDTPEFERARSHWEATGGFMKENAEAVFAGA